MEIIVGSKALEYFGYDLPRNKNRTDVIDTDIWVDDDKLIVKKPRYDYHVIPRDILDMIECVDGYATPESILAIKMSHLSWDIFWEKTKEDILFLHDKGIENFNRELYQELKNYWIGVHGNKDFLSLNKNKDSFFDDFVNYKYDHDYLHELVAYPQPPMYTHCLKDGEEVLIDKDKFFEMDHIDQVQMFHEEITVIAIERWIVSNKMSWFKAYQYALKKTIISLTKNWANDFIIENLKYFNASYTEFDHALNELNLFNDNYTSLKTLDNIIYGSIKDHPLYNVLIYKMIDIDDILTILCLGEEHDDYELLLLLGPNEIDSIKFYMNTIGWEHIKNEKWCVGEYSYVKSVFKLGGKLFSVEYKENRNHENYMMTNWGIRHTLLEVEEIKKIITIYE